MRVWQIGMSGAGAAGPTRADKEAGVGLGREVLWPIHETALALIGGRSEVRLLTKPAPGEPQEGGVRIPRGEGLESGNAEMAVGQSLKRSEPQRLTALGHGVLAATELSGWTSGAEQADPLRPLPRI